MSSFAGRFLSRLPFLRGAGFTVGASASIFGLLGALVHYGGTAGAARSRRSDALRGHRVRLRAHMPGVDNFAHAGGFLGGYATSAFFNPLTRERGDHLLIAVGCIAATVLSILYSVLSGLSFFTAS